MDFNASEAKGFSKIPHQGTFNANPLSAAAGVAMLDQVAEGDITAKANEQGEKLKSLWNSVFAAEAIPWAAYGLGSSVYIFTNPDNLEIDPETFDATCQPMAVMEKSGNHPAAGLFRLAMLVNGVDISSKPGAIVSAVHEENDLAEAIVNSRLPDDPAPLRVCLRHPRLCLLPLAAARSASHSQRVQLTI